MASGRKLVSICLHHNILFKAKHIRGIHNNLADALSRLQVQTFSITLTTIVLGLLSSVLMLT